MSNTIDKQKIFPRQVNKEGGWTIDTDYLEKVSSKIEQTDSDELPDSIPSWEQIELVLLAIEALSNTTEQTEKYNPSCPKCTEALEITRNDDYYCRNCHHSFGSWGDGTLIVDDEPTRAERVKEIWNGLRDRSDFTAMDAVEKALAAYGINVPKEENT